MWRVTQHLKVADNSWALRPQSRSVQILMAVTKRQKCLAEAEGLYTQYIYLAGAVMISRVSALQRTPVCQHLMTDSGMNLSCSKEILNYSNAKFVTVVRDIFSDSFAPKSGPPVSYCKEKVERPLSVPDEGKCRLYEQI